MDVPAVEHPDRQAIEDAIFDVYDQEPARGYAVVPRCRVAADAVLALLPSLGYEKRRCLCWPEGPHHFADGRVEVNPDCPLHGRGEPGDTDAIAQAIRDACEAWVLQPGPALSRKNQPMYDGAAEAVLPFIEAARQQGRDEARNAIEALQSRAHANAEMHGNARDVPGALRWENEAETLDDALAAIDALGKPEAQDE